MNIIFSPLAWEQYTDWQANDKKIAKKINDLIKSIRREGLMKGKGKPEPLRHIKAYSRRITDEHRLVYTADENKNLIIIACVGHYED